MERSEKKISQISYSVCIAFKKKIFVFFLWIDLYFCKFKTIFFQTSPSLKEGLFLKWGLSGKDLEPSWVFWVQTKRKMMNLEVQYYFLCFDWQGKLTKTKHYFCAHDKPRLVKSRGCVILTVVLALNQIPGIPIWWASGVSVKASQHGGRWHVGTQETGSQRISHDLPYDVLLVPMDFSISEISSTFHTALVSHKCSRWPGDIWLHSKRIPL